MEKRNLRMGWTATHNNSFPSVFVIQSYLYYNYPKLRTCFQGGFSQRKCLFCVLFNLYSTRCTVSSYMEQKTDHRIWIRILSTVLARLQARKELRDEYYYNHAILLQSRIILHPLIWFRRHTEMESCELRIFDCSITDVILSECLESHLSIRRKSFSKYIL
jgi:hypothetical protein